MTDLEARIRHLEAELARTQPLADLAINIAACVVSIARRETDPAEIERELTQNLVPAVYKGPHSGYQAALDECVRRGDMTRRFVDGEPKYSLTEQGQKIGDALIIEAGGNNTEGR